MRILNQIFIVGVIIFIIFAIKSDYKSLYSKSVAYLQGEISKSSSIYKEKIGDLMSNTLNDSLNKVVGNIETPGALVVPDSYLTSNTKSINLSSKNIITITNKYRLANGGLSELKENSKLNFSAEKKLQDMFVKQYFEHMSPEGLGVGDLGEQVGYEYIIIGENLALGNFKDDQALVDAWMASPGHKANILNKRYTEIGVAVAKGVYNGKNVWMAVQHFALPKSSCPSIDNVLKGIIELDQNNIKEMEANMTSRKARIDSGAVYDGLTTNDQITQYNSMVNDYNKLITNIKEKINKYNEQVRDFNNCIAEVN